MHRMSCLLPELTYFSFLIIIFLTTNEYYGARLKMEYVEVDLHATCCAQSLNFWTATNMSSLFFRATSVCREFSTLSRKRIQFVLWLCSLHLIVFPYTRELIVINIGEQGRIGSPNWHGKKGKAQSTLIANRKSKNHAFIRSLEI